MHILMTDVLACPRCGPPYGLILVPGEVVARRVRSGFLACANCRERYPIEAGIADLRADGAQAAAAPTLPDRSADADREGAIRLAALMGVSEGPAIVLVAGPGAAHAAELAALVPELEVIAAATGAGPLGAGEGVSPLRIDRRLPIQNAKLRAIALTGDAADHLAEEAARVVAPAGRVVVEPATEATAARLADRGLRVLAHEGGTLVATRAAAARGS